MRTVIIFITLIMRTVIIFITLITCCRYFIVSVWVVAAMVASPFLVYRKMVIVRVGSNK